MSEQGRVSPEIALEEFKRFAEAWNLDTDTDRMDVDEKGDFKQAAGRITRAIESGLMTISEDGHEVGYVLRHPVLDTSEVTLRRPNGAGFLTMDRHKEREGIHKTFSLVASMGRIPPALLSRFDGVDIKPLLGVAALFLGS